MKSTGVDFIMFSPNEKNCVCIYNSITKLFHVKDMYIDYRALLNSIIVFF